MPRYITASQYKKLISIPRSKLSVRTKVFAGVIVQNNGKILLVRDVLGNYPGFDIPGGKMLWGEEIKECAVREFKEETGLEVELENLLGIYQRKASEEEDDYIRFIFIGKVVKLKPKKVYDPNIVEMIWLDVNKIHKNKIKLKSPELMREIHDFLHDQKFPLSVIDTYVW